MDTFILIIGLILLAVILRKRKDTDEIEANNFNLRLDRLRNQQKEFKPLSRTGGYQPSPTTNKTSRPPKRV